MARARAVWTGTIVVGLVQVPVRLLTAVRHKDISFNQIDERNGARIRYRKVSEATGEEVPSEHIVKGVEIENRGWVVLDDDDLAAVAPAKSKEIDVSVFVPADQVPAVMYDKPYLLAPGKFGHKPYVLLAEALAESGRVAIGRFVMRQTENLCAIRSDGQRLTLTTLVFPDEIVNIADVDDDQNVSLDEVSVSDREVAMARGLVDALSDDWEPAKFRDTYRGEVMALITAKAEGKAFVAADAPERDDVVDLASALEASVAAAQAARQRHPTARKASAAQTKKPRARAKKTA
jgi:DNA end-binding protein Ku